MISSDRPDRNMIMDAGSPCTSTAHLHGGEVKPDWPMMSHRNSSLAAEIGGRS